MLKLSISRFSNIEIVYDNHNIYKFMQIHKNKEDRYVILEKQSWCVLSLRHNRDTKNNKNPENKRVPHVIIRFKIKRCAT